MIWNGLICLPGRENECVIVGAKQMLEVVRIDAAVRENRSPQK